LSVAKSPAGQPSKYRQIAAQLRAQIGAGEYPPMSWLPSESQLGVRYEVSRRTVRDALAELRAQGLIAVVDGKGAYVRPATELARHTHTRTVTRNRDTFTDTATNEWSEVEKPVTYREDASAETAQLLGVPTGSTLFGCDRLLSDPTGQQRMLHRLYLPWQTANDIPALETDPFRHPGELYALLAEAGHKLHWTEHVTARMPAPDDATTLRIPEGTPVITIRRLTHNTDGRALALEETRLSASETQLAYTLTPTRPVRTGR
jgi:GntR family transcriptional regulator